jgi:hypothetical protein
MFIFFVKEYTISLINLTNLLFLSEVQELP